MHIARPRSTSHKAKATDNKKLITKRPMPESGISAFGRWVGTHSWDELSEDLDANKLTDKFFDVVHAKVDSIFPLKTARIPINNKPWFNHKLRELSKKKKQIFRKEGRSDKYKTVVKEFVAVRKTAINDYLNKTVDTVTRKVWCL